MKRIQLFLVYFFNFFGVLSVKYNSGNNKFELSKWTGLKNICILPFLFIAKPYLLRFLVLGIESYKIKISNITGVTVVLSTIMLVLSRAEVVVAFLCISIQILNYKSVLEFLNKFAMLLESSDKIYLLRPFMKSFLRNLAGSLLIISVAFTIEFVVWLNFSWAMLFYFMIRHVEMLMIWSFTSFLNMFLIFFEHNLRTVNELIKRNSRKSLKYSLEPSRILRKFYDLREMFMSFNKTFGLVLTLLVALYISEITMKVSF